MEASAEDSVMNKAWERGPAVSRQKIVFQEIADSPTVKYYTDWRLFAERLEAGEATVFDDVSTWFVGDEYDCIVSLQGREAIISARKCSVEIPWAPIAGEGEGARAFNREFLLDYHSRRATNRIVLKLEPSVEKVAVVTRGGNGYTGYSVKVVVPEGSHEITIVDTAYTSGEGLKTQCFEFIVGEGANIVVNHVSLHEASPVYTYSLYRLSENSRVHIRAAGVSGPMTRHRTDVVLEGESASVEALLGYISRSGLRGDYIVNVLHESPRTESRILSRGAVWGDGVLALRGIARVLRSAPHSRTRVEAHVTVFDDRAKGYAVPMLEIYTGLVDEASHSASVSSLGEDEAFYMAARGLARRDQRFLVAAGVLQFSGVFDAVPGLFDEIRKLLI